MHDRGGSAVPRPFIRQGCHEPSSVRIQPDSLPHLAFIPAIYSDNDAVTMLRGTLLAPPAPPR